MSVKVQKNEYGTKKTTTIVHSYMMLILSVW